MTTYKTYRNGAGSLSARIQAAVESFYKKHQVLPASIAVNVGEVGIAQETCAALALAVPVEGNGGCLAGEVWLAETREGDQC